MKNSLIILIFLSFWISVSATTIRVPQDQPTIQAGIDAASNGDTVLVANGIYTGTGNRDLDFNGKTIVVKSVNGADYTTIDCELSGRGFYFHNGEGASSVVDGFTITKGNGFNGGAIYCDNSSPTIINNIITENSTQNHGGAIYCENYSSPNILNNIINNNSAPYQGGAICCFSNSGPFILNNTILGNSAKFYGGIKCGTGTITNITGNIIVHNTALYTCGAIACCDSTIIINNTITDNSGGYGGIYCWDSSTTIINTIIWNNNPQEIYLSGGPITMTYSDVRGGWAGDGNIDSNPLFVNPANDDFHLCQGSPCIDAGDPDPIYNDVDGTRNDMGCYGGPGGTSYTYPEYSTVTIHVPVDQPTIQAGINAASDGDTVLVQPGNYIENIDFNGKNIVVASLFLTTRDTIYISQTTIDGNSNGSVVTFKSGEDSTALLDGFLITNGYHHPGGGIMCMNASPLIRNNIITDNTAKSGNGIGGGIFLQNSSSKIINCRILNNTALGMDASNGWGGGIGSEYSDIKIINCKINNNWGNAAGGGVGDINSHIQLVGCEIADNSSLGSEGLFFQDSFPILINNTIIRNSNGALYYIRSNPIIRNTIIWENNIRGWGGDVYISYSNIQGGWVGEGNIDADPLFVDAENGDFHLQQGSPCIDAGDPDLDSDGITWENDSDDQNPDGTRLDMGAYYFHQTQVATPMFSPAPGKYTTAQDVIISCSTSGATIHYTANGQDPTESDISYRRPIHISSTTTLKARAYKSGWNPSNVAIGTYTITGIVATPTYNPPPGTYTTAQDVTISCSTSGATIHYTTNGQDPTESDPSYSSPIHIASTTTLKARAYKSGLDPSSVATGMYTIGEPPEISVSPDSLSADLSTGDTTTQTLTISNSGGSDLNFGISMNSLTGDGSQNYAFQFDGVDDYVDIPDDPSLQITDFITLETWIKYEVGGTYYQPRILSKGPDGEGYELLTTSTGSIRNLEFRIDPGNVISNASLSAGDWYHIAASYNGSEIKLFVNGNLDISLSVSGSLNISTLNLFIGQKSTSGFDKLKGCVDEVRIWNVARTQAEIQADMHREISGTEPGLVGYWRFNEGSGNTAFDQTPNGNDGSLHGGVAWVVSSAPITSWLSVTPTSGTVEAGSSSDITVNFDATGLSGGDYSADIVITSNDPDEQEVTVPVHMHVTGVTDNVPPEIIDHSTASTAVTGQPISIRADVTDNTSVASVKLHYRKGGVDVFTSTSMFSIGSNSYQGTIPSSAVTERGVEYYISAQDATGNTSTSPTTNPTTSPNVIRVSFLVLNCPSSTPANSYRMISVPVDLNSESPGNTLEDDLGSYDDTKWRLLRWQSGGYREYTVNSIDSFEPGNAFWLITKDTHWWDVGSGQSVATSQNYTITLQSGWNQIACPFAFAVNWSDVIKYGNVQAPVGYEGTGNNTSGYQYNRSQLIPWKGYCVKNLEGSPVSIEIPPVAASGSASKSSEPSEWIEESGDWIVRIKAECGQSTDYDNYIGCLASADNEWDTHDFSEAPPIGNFISLYFPHKDWKKYPDIYTGDFRSRSVEGSSWDFVVRTDIPQSKVYLSFENLNTLPQDFSAVLVDESAKNTKDLHHDSNYTFLSKSGETERTFRILIGKASFVEENCIDIPLKPSAFQLFPNYPNPFNAATTIPYNLPVNSIVTLRILDLLGREVVVLEQESRKEAGCHTVIWGGRDIKGSPVPSGIYIVHLKAGDFVRYMKIVLTK